MNFATRITGVFIITLFLLSTVKVYATEQIINATGMYIAGASESLNDAKNRALEDAMRQATEQAGVLVNSYSKTHNMVLTDDEVTTVATKIVKINKKTFEVSLLSDSEIKVVANIEAIVNIDNISDDILALKEENQKLKEEKNEISKKQNVLESLHIIAKKIREKYKGDIFTYAQPKKKIKLYPDSHYSLGLENFYTDMKYGDYDEAVASIGIASSHYKKQKNVDKARRYYYLDKTICEFQLKRIEAYLAKNDYLIAMIECVYFVDAIEKNNYRNQIDPKLYETFCNYFILLKDYFDIYEQHFTTF